jgi:hypothetical protein
VMACHLFLRRGVVSRSRRTGVARVVFRMQVDRERPYYTKCNSWQLSARAEWREAKFGRNALAASKRAPNRRCSKTPFRTADRAKIVA